MMDDWQIVHELPVRAAVVEGKGSRTDVSTRHGRACPGHPRLTLPKDCEEVDARDERGHDDAICQSIGGGIFADLKPGFQHRNHGRAKPLDVPICNIQGRGEIDDVAKRPDPNALFHESAL